MTSAPADPAPPPVVVRRATAADAPTLAHHRVEMFRAMGTLAEDLYEPLVEASRRYFEAAVPAGEYVAWVASPAERPGEVVAGAGVQVRRLLPRPAPDGRGLSSGVEGLVLNVFTERPWRRRGIAELLMRHVIDWARARGVASLVLHASDDGRPLYERLGFVATTEMRYTGPLRPGADM